VKIVECLSRADRVHQSYPLRGPRGADDSGDLVYLRANGQINLWRGGHDLASAANGFDPVHQVVHVRVQAVGSSIQVWADGVLQIDVAGPPVPGYVDLSTDFTQTRFNALEVY
jgi:hypothetical protein